VSAVVVSDSVGSVVVVVTGGGGVVVTGGGGDMLGCGPGSVPSGGGSATGPPGATGMTGADPVTETGGARTVGGPEGTGPGVEVAGRRMVELSAGGAFSGVSVTRVLLSRVRASADVPATASASTDITIIARQGGRGVGVATGVDSGAAT